jgi:hypothetical protein
MIHERPVLVAGVVTKFSNKTGRAYLLDTAAAISDRTRSSCDHVTLNKPQGDMMEPHAIFVLLIGWLVI